MWTAARSRPAPRAVGRSARSAVGITALTAPLLRASFHKRRCSRAGPHMRRFLSEGTFALPSRVPHALLTSAPPEGQRGQRCGVDRCGVDLWPSGYAGGVCGRLLCCAHGYDGYQPDSPRYRRRLRIPRDGVSRGGRRMCGRPYGSTGRARSPPDRSRPVGLPLLITYVDHRGADHETSDPPSDNRGDRRGRDRLAQRPRRQPDPHQHRAQPLTPSTSTTDFSVTGFEGRSPGPARWASAA